MSLDFHIIIPARYASSRLPGKLMRDLGGMSVLARVYAQAKKTNPKSITIATDSQEIFEHALDFGAPVIMTAKEHRSGTERIAEVVSMGNYHQNDIIVNVQGDEPFISPLLIKQVALVLAGADTKVATLSAPIENLEQFTNPNVVKVVTDSNDCALYFSRSPIPLFRDEPNSFLHAKRHVGLYAYRADFLLECVACKPCELENIEALEQLRFLYRGFPIRVANACQKPAQDINTEEDLINAMNALAKLAPFTD